MKRNNYDRYLRDAIASALHQTYDKTEVIVVDDGSTDRSRAIIASYENRMTAVLKANGGQASAFNAGFRVSRGEVICFLDADDVLLPTAIERAMELHAVESVTKVHWPLLIVDQHGVETGDIYPQQPLPAGDLRDALIQNGPAPFLNPPTSGNAWSRQFLDKVMPMPEEEFRLGADAYLLTLAPLFGPIARVSKPQGYYRVHTSNNFWHMTFDAQLAYERDVHARLCCALSRHARMMGVNIQPEALEPSAWVQELRRATEQIVATIPHGDTFILVDDNTWWPGDIAGRQRLPFLERDGQYWGPPLDDSHAIQELVCMRRSGATFMLFASACFWWLDYYAGLRAYLDAHYICVMRDDSVLIYNLRTQAQRLPAEMKPT